MIRVPVLAVLALVALVPGCRDGSAAGLGVAETTYRATPVVIETFTVGDVDTIRGLPRVVAGGADTTRGRRGGGPSTYGVAVRDPLELEVAWVELLTDRAYAASLELDPADLPRGPTGAPSLVVVIGPNGLLLVADDAGGVQRDAAAVCAPRAPERDTAWRRRDPLSLPGLTEALADDYPPVRPDPRCPEPGR